MNLKTMYRLLRCKDGQPHTLFHGLNGSRRLPLDSILVADEKLVTNPGKALVSHQFLSGFHVIEGREDCEKYMERFKDHSDLVMCAVDVGNTRPKPRATSPVLLAKRIRINTKDWEEACSTLTQR